MGIKQEIITELYRNCKQKNNFIFNNDDVKQLCKKLGFGNPFDVTKLDNTSKFPKILLEENFFILHLGEGKHIFYNEINHGFHKFESVDDKNIFNWKYRKSILNEFDTSESNILSVANNQRIIHDFLYEDIVASPKVYNARRTKMTFSYNICEETIFVKNLQMEIDLTMEYLKQITIFEGKNGFPNDFAVYQLFHPFKYYSKLKEKNKLDINQISCCYVLRNIENGKSKIRLYKYIFEDENDMASIKLLKNAQYNLIVR